ncbi:type II toxin-antitoxin system HigB family toxin [Pseudomonas sp. HR96]|uniref:type II toxin-antitoxin system HigB family toxin n=1 Tax=Pseudomonas sp. HR96 TaxID=1027966 RepID=UPI002A7474F4|nr:type II toxin-antitoxin system HigB family toxin [Pseudomonas sp. HR96]WPP01931.1 type II toxin-antitoxin system HigB family toxin [Pseudomonas sp. HR96]
MDVLKKSCFIEAASLYPNCSSALLRCLRLLSAAQPQHYQDLQKLFGRGLDLLRPRADDHWVVIDIGGNHLRLIGGLNYTRQKFYGKHIFTHADYAAASRWYAGHPQGVMP